MSKIKFLLQRMRRMDWRAMRQTAKSLHQKTGKSTLWLLSDMLRCAVRYGAGYVDYRIAELYNVPEAKRGTHITRAVSNRIVARMNDKAYWHFFDDKAEFNTLFSEQIGRGWLDLRKASQADLDAWARGRGAVIGKPMEGSSGVGIVKMEAANLPPLSELMASGVTLLEDCIAQHAALSKLCPTSVNTVRIATLLGEKKRGIVYAYLRIGNGAVMDNVDQGGMAAPIDLDTGKLCGVGADKKGNRFERHPMTNTPIPGFQIPFWDKAKAMCEAAAQKVPQVRFVAWDVAITETGACFIEGNSFPSHAIPQFAAHYPDGVGILPRFQEFVEI